MFTIDMLTLFAIFGTFQGLVFAAVFWLRNRHFSNKVFSLLLLATSIRIAKNIFVHLRELNPEMFSSYELWRLCVYIGLAHQFAIGPLFFLYFQTKIQPKFKWRRRYWAHFIPYFLLLVISSFIQWSFWEHGGLLASYISILAYYLITFRRFFTHDKAVDPGTSKWLKALLLISFVLMGAYSPALFHYMGYIGGAFLYTVAILTVGYVMLTNKGNISLFRTKYETSSLGDRQAREIKKKLQEIMRTERPYLQPELNLQFLAGRISTHPHHLSRVINQEFSMSFSEFINSFRLQEAVERLQDPQYRHLKISALAYDCGFNSVPTFNTLFRKVYKTTPSKFRKQQIRIQG